PLAHPVGGVSRAFPSAATLASVPPEELALPASRGRALVGLARALAEGSVDLGPGADREEAAARLLALPGLGPWTVAYVRMRALADPDAFPAGDLGLRRALERAGLPGGVREAAERAQAWRPYRAYAVQYLWSGAVLRATNDEESVA
ncbi:MAG: DNA-3-methyladenine glycosylase family protein, partial [Acidimicrobiales bacterium]